MSALTASAPRWSLAYAPPPEAAISIAPNRISGARLASRRDQPAVGACATQPLPDGVVAASLNATNIIDAGALTKALDAVLEQLGRPRRVGLVLADPVAKVSLMRFAQVPARAQDLDELVAWQLRKTAPFPIEEAQLSYVPGFAWGDGQEFIATMARRSVIREYEAVCAAAGAHAGIVDIATFNILNMLAAATDAPAGDWLLIHVGRDYMSIAIVREAHPIFFRTRTDRVEGGLADLVHQTAMYYEDRLEGRGFTRAVLSGVAETAGHSADVEQMRRGLEERLRVEVTSVNVGSTATLTDRIAASPAFTDTLAPLVGLLVR